MLSDIELDILHYLERTALEGLQMHGRYLRDLVNRHARSLPLRYIHEFDVSATTLSSQYCKRSGRSVLSINFIIMP